MRWYGHHAGTCLDIISEKNNFAVDVPLDAFLAQALVLQSVTVRLLDGNDVSGPLISNSFNFFLPVVKNSHGTAALLKKLTLQKLFKANQKK